MHDMFGAILQTIAYILRKGCYCSFGLIVCNLKTLIGIFISLVFFHQGKQIGRIFVYWEIVYSGHFLY
jgi:hypothetical protein